MRPGNLSIIGTFLKVQRSRSVAPFTTSILPLPALPLCISSPAVRTDGSSTGEVGNACVCAHRSTSDVGSACVCAHRVFTQMQTIIQIKPPVEYSQNQAAC